MPYESRFGRTSKRNDCRHDPGYAGIFIHGGSCDAGPFGACGDMLRFHANRFTLTIPTRNKRDEVVDLESIYTHLRRTQPEAPTFYRAVATACQVRREFPVLADCPIYACTDLHLDAKRGGSYKVQRVA